MQISNPPDHTTPDHVNICCTARHRYRSM